ncbi:MAG: sigma-70 family RNA polymerase sigma factor [Candidatus Rokuibacteriota bacterium]
MIGSVLERSEGVALLRRMAGGDRQSFAQFYDHYARLAFSLIQRILVQRAEAEDVLQEVFWQIWTDARAYDEQRGSPEAWVLTRARSRAIDRLRSIRRRGEISGALLDERMVPELDATMQNPGSRVEDRTLIENALTILPDPQRHVIEMAFYAGLTQADIAQRLGEPLGTIKTRMRTGLERLRTHFRAVKGVTS